MAWKLNYWSFHERNPLELCALPNSTNQTDISVSIHLRLGDIVDGMQMFNASHKGGKRDFSVVLRRRKLPLRLFRFAMRVLPFVIGVLDSRGCKTHIRIVSEA